MWKSHEHAHYIILPPPPTLDNTLLSHVVHISTRYVSEFIALNYSLLSIQQPESNNSKLNDMHRKTHTTYPHMFLDFISFLGLFKEIAMMLGLNKFPRTIVIICKCLKFKFRAPHLVGRKTRSIAQLLLCTKIVQ